MRQVLKSCWNANPDRRPKLGGVCLDLRTEIAGFEEKKSSRSLLDRTEHLRLHSTRSLLKAWLALGLPTSSRRLVTRLGEPSSELKPITEHETTESQENAILSLLEVPDDSQPEDAWDDRCLFGSAVECQMPSSWTDLSWQLSRVPESLELWQDGRGAERRHSCYLFKAELREPQVDLSAACFYYYQEAAQSHQIDDECRKWTVVVHPWDSAPPGTVAASGQGWLPLDGPHGRAGVAMEQLVIRLAAEGEGNPSLELVVALFRGAPDATTPAPSSTFSRFLRSLRLRDLTGLLGDV